MSSMKLQGDRLTDSSLVLPVRLSTLVWLLTALWMLFSMQASANDNHQTAAPDVDGISSLIVNILHYVRWPESSEPRLFCITGNSLHTDTLHTLENLPAGWSGQVLRARPDSPYLTSCSALYMGQLDQHTRQALLERTLSQPILTFSENSPQCTAGGIFCLNTSTQPMRFRINLDTAARSTLRIHPKVLLLGTSRDVAP